MNKVGTLVAGFVLYTAALIYVTWQMCEARAKSGSTGEVMTVVINISELIVFFVLLAASGIGCVLLIKKSHDDKFPVLLVPAAIVFGWLSFMFWPVLWAWLTNMTAPDSAIGRLLPPYPHYALVTTMWLGVMLLLIVAVFVGLVMVLTAWRLRWPFGKKNGSAATRQDMHHAGV